jgi:hypothetical protein
MRGGQHPDKPPELRPGRLPFPRLKAQTGTVGPRLCSTAASLRRVPGYAQARHPRTLGSRSVAVCAQAQVPGCCLHGEMTLRRRRRKIASHERFSQHPDHPCAELPSVLRGSQSGCSDQRHAMEAG